jgi:TM2 domain-containing membrane protein YozV
MPIEDIQIIYAVFAGMVIIEGFGKMTLHFRGKNKVTTISTLGLYPLDIFLAFYVVLLKNNYKEPHRIGDKYLTFHAL